jgi:hypothetical protein
VNAERFQRFATAYRHGLLEAVTASYERSQNHAYDYGPDQVPTVATKILTEIEKVGGIDSVNIESAGFRRACKALGIKHSRKAITAFLETPSDPERRWTVTVARVVRFTATVTVTATDDLNAGTEAIRLAESSRFEWGEAIEDTIEVMDCDAEDEE